MDLEALHKIEKLKSRYCRYVDTKQWKKLRELFDDTAYVEGFGSARDGANVDEFIRGLEGRLSDVVSVHHCHQPDIEFIGENRARGIWSMQDFLQWPRPIEAREGSRITGFVGYGYYEDEYVRSGEAWLIAFTRLTRIRVDPIEERPFPVRGNSKEPSADWLENK